MDASQDWHLLYAREDHCRTVMKVVRKLDTCDDQDYKITASVLFITPFTISVNVGTLCLPVPREVTTGERGFVYQPIFLKSYLFLH